MAMRGAEGPSGDQNELGGGPTGPPPNELQNLRVYGVFARRQAGSGPPAPRDQPPGAAGKRNRQPGGWSRPGKEKHRPGRFPALPGSGNGARPPPRLAGSAEVSIDQPADVKDE